MKFSKHLFYVAACGVATLALSVSANAELVGSGTAYTVTEDQAKNAATPIPSGATTDATFNFNGITFNNPASYTVGGFLTQPTSTASSVAGSGLGASLDPTLFSFTAQENIASGAKISITHDDGVSFYINGTSYISAPGPTGSETSAITIGSAFTNATVQIVYGECCGAPAVLTVTDSGFTPTPEPASIALMASMLLGVGGIAYRRRRNAA